LPFRYTGEHRNRKKLLARSDVFAARFEYFVQGLVHWV